VFSSTSHISLGDIPPEISGSGVDMCIKENIGPDNGMTLKSTVGRYERHLIKETLKKYGKTSDAARVLGIDPTTLTRKLKKGS
jgi:transcriptional regulator with PAS, ATPase and Fis domain